MFAPVCSLAAAKSRTEEGRGVTFLSVLSQCWLPEWVAGCVSPQADSGPVSWQGGISHSWPGISRQTAQVFKFKYLQMSKYPFCDCKTNAQEFPSNLMESHWKHLNKHHYEKHPITSLRKAMQDSWLDRRLDVNCRIHWQLLGQETTECCVYPPWTVPPSMNWPITDREKKRTNQSACSFNFLQTKHSLLLFRERSFIQPSSNICGFLYPFKGCQGQRMQTGRQKMSGSLSCNQTATRDSVRMHCLIHLSSKRCHLQFVLSWNGPICWLVTMKAC